MPPAASSLPTSSPRCRLEHGSSTWRAARSSTNRRCSRRFEAAVWPGRSSTSSGRSRCHPTARGGTCPTSSSRRMRRGSPCASSTSSSSRTCGVTWPASRCSTRSIPSADTSRWRMPSMDDRQGPVTRLGPDSGGRGPGEPSVRYYTWEWGPDDARRPGLPWIGIFLLVFGGLLLIQQLFPQFEALGSVVGAGGRAGVPRQMGGRSRHGLALCRARSSPRWPCPVCSMRRGSRPTACQRSASGSRSCSSPACAPRPAAGSAGSSGSVACWR